YSTSTPQVFRSESTVESAGAASTTRLKNFRRSGLCPTSTPPFDHQSSSLAFRYVSPCPQNAPSINVFQKFPTSRSAVISPQPSEMSPSYLHSSKITGLPYLR